MVPLRLSEVEILESEYSVPGHYRWQQQHVQLSALPNISTQAKILVASPGCVLEKEGRPFEPYLDTCRAGAGELFSLFVIYLAFHAACVWTAHELLRVAVQLGLSDAYVDATFNIQSH